jgi:hypothetical protein
MSDPVQVYKLDHQGRVLFSYPGRLLHSGPPLWQLEAFFGLPDVVTAYHHFRRGDRMLEWFYADRWYNVFELHDVEDDRLKGWYCNITRPARFENGGIYAEDLALDVMVYPDGRFLVLDEDEFAALELDAPTRQQALAALGQLQHLIHQGQEMFCFTS